MKTSFKILIKFIFIFIVLFGSPVIKGIHMTIGNINDQFVLFNQTKSLSPIKIENMTMLNVVRKEDIPYREIDIDKQEEIKDIPTNNEKKSIYIYSTHQKEKYLDEKSVVDGSYYLAELLKEKGYEVIVEDRNLSKELSDRNLSYDQSYLISRGAINDAIIEHKGFDLMIDFHRDSVPRNSSYIKDDTKAYAKLMIVLGGLSSHFNQIHLNAKTLYDKTNQIQHGIMKNILVREAYYNQDISENMLLIEVGSDQNYYEEVKNSIEVLAKAIDEMMR